MPDEKTEESFDLDRQIKRWKLDLLTREPITDGHLSELDKRLRETIVRLQQKGISPEEAYYLALQRTGEQSLLHAETTQQKITTLWHNRMFWLLMGMFGCWYIPTVVRDSVYYLGFPRFITYNNFFTSFTLAYIAPAVAGVICTVLSFIFLARISPSMGQVSKWWSYGYFSRALLLLLILRGIAGTFLIVMHIHVREKGRSGSLWEATQTLLGRWHQHNFPWDGLIWPVTLAILLVYLYPFKRNRSETAASH